MTVAVTRETDGAVLLQMLRWSKGCRDLARSVQTTSPFPPFDLEIESSEDVRLRKIDSVTAYPAAIGLYLPRDRRFLL